MVYKKLKGLQALSRDAYTKNKEDIFDIIFFGSAVKGKTKPGDIDIAVIFNHKIGKEKIDTIISQFGNMHVEHLFLNEIYKEPLWATILQEGYSLVRSEFIHRLIGFESSFLFVYGLENLDKVSKSRFCHALFGFGSNKGILSEAGGKQLGRGCVSAPTANSEKVRSFLETWKVNYSVHRALLY